ncbi:hypothetical protein [Fluviicola taffensis]|uniref:Uncharacterized protein n=1 Tax=Fluviicola taffensis (strain DSM 16823 / NCIMB 13979 / RW262) TaxID=755732 RepID=F2IGD0_FLUTR|nr:hypothetical protein [Fluviicola taffensis]AEA45796.1 hypothetical protein Fluta_3830 [Fluviicola taffensis DSM 16823]
MNKLLLFFLSLMSGISFAQELSSAQKKEWKTELQKMEKSDQYYRVKMAKNPALNNDSIWKLQSDIDSINKATFVELTTKYGYPTMGRVRYAGTIGMILHFTLEEDFIQLKELFYSELKKGNMPPKEYAWWYDRCQRNMHQPIYFGQYTNEKFCGDQLKLFNERRKEIGLEELVGNLNCI